MQLQLQTILSLIQNFDVLSATLETINQPEVVGSGKTWLNQGFDPGFQKLVGLNSLGCTNKTRRVGVVASFYSTKLNHELFFEKQEDHQIHTTKVT